MAALINCTDCGREISPNATACPGCGAPVKAPRASSGGGCLAAALVIMLVVVFIIVVPALNSPAPTTATSAPTAPRHPFEPAEQDGLALRLQAQRLINRAGERCDAIVNVRGGGRIDNGDVFLLADCVGGDTHTLLLTPDDQIRYYMSCETVFNPAC